MIRTFGFLALLMLGCYAGTVSAQDVRSGIVIQKSIIAQKASMEVKSQPAIKATKAVESVKAVAVEHVAKPLVATKTGMTAEATKSTINLTTQVATPPAASDADAGSGIRLPRKEKAAPTPKPTEAELAERAAARKAEYEAERAATSAPVPAGTPLTGADAGLGICSKNYERCKYGQNAEFEVRTGENGRQCRAFIGCSGEEKYRCPINRTRCANDQITVSDIDEHGCRVLVSCVNQSDLRKDCPKPDVWSCGHQERVYKVVDGCLTLDRCVPTPSAPTTESSISPEMRNKMNAAAVQATKPRLNVNGSVYTPGNDSSLEDDSSTGYTPGQ